MRCDNMNEIDPFTVFSPPLFEKKHDTPRFGAPLAFNWFDCTVECTRDIEAIRADWAELQKNGLSTPYQHLNWVDARVTTLEKNVSKTTNYLYGIVRGADQRIVILFPLKIVTFFGVRFVTMLGGKHANYQMPVFEKVAFETLTPVIMEAILAQLAQNIRQKFGTIDLFLFENQPQSWIGHTNPLALLNSEPSPSDAYGLVLEPDFNVTINNVMSKDTFKKLRKKLKNFEAMPDFKLIHAQTEDEVNVLLTAFFDQKRTRFAQLGIHNPFDTIEIQHFLTQLFMCGRLIVPRTASLNGISVDGKIIAVIGGVISCDLFSGMITSFDTNPVYARNSPGQVLFLKMIELKITQGLKYFDFGVGEAVYKDIFAGYATPLYDSLIPITMKGRVACVLAQKQYALKRMIKRTPILWQTFQKLRVLKARASAIIKRK